MATSIPKPISIPNGAAHTHNVLCCSNNLKNGKFDLMPAVEGSGLAIVSVGRGAAFGDIFNDGKVDVIINNMDGVPVLLRNVNSDRHHWVELFA